MIGVIFYKLSDFYAYFIGRFGPLIGRIIPTAILAFAFGVLFVLVSGIHEMYLTDTPLKKSIREYKLDQARAEGDKYEETVKELFIAYTRFYIGLKNAKDYFFSSVLLAADNKYGMTEIDLVSVNKKGIFVYECKYKKPDEFNSDKTCYGEMDDIYAKTLRWRHTEKEDEVYNPVLQNKGHIEVLSTYLPEKYKDIPIFNFVVSNCGFETRYMGNAIKTEPYAEREDYIRIKPDNLFLVHCKCPNYGPKRSLGDELEALPDILTDNDVEEISEIIRPHEMTAIDKVRFYEEKKYGKTPVWVDYM